MPAGALREMRRCVRTGLLISCADVTQVHRNAVWDLTLDISDYHDLGDVVVSVGHMRIHGKGSGVDIESPVAYVNEFEDGSIRKIRAYLDPKQALEAVGLSEQDARR